MAGIIFEKKGKTAYVILNRPEQRNAIDLGMRQDLCDAWKETERDNDIWSIILTGGEKDFSTGQDLTELTEFRKREPTADLPLINLETFGMNVKKPVIAAISGYCLGAGFLLTLVASDIRVASDTTIFGMPEIKVGVPLALGIPPLLARHFSPAITIELIMLGRNISAEDAYRSGYVNKIVSPGDLIGQAEKYADEVNTLSPFLVKKIKEISRYVMAPDPKEIALSNAICMLCRHSEDYVEGPRSFKEKRKPEWKGR